MGECKPLPGGGGAPTEAADGMGGGGGAPTADADGIDGGGGGAPIYSGANIIWKQSLKAVHHILASSTDTKGGQPGVNLCATWVQPAPPYQYQRRMEWTQAAAAPSLPGQPGPRGAGLAAQAPSLEPAVPCT
jgi:hypothetical protein